MSFLVNSGPVILLRSSFAGGHHLGQGIPLGERDGQTHSVLMLAQSVAY